MGNLASKTRAAVKALMGLDGEAIAFMAACVLIWLGISLLALTHGWR